MSGCSYEVQYFGSVLVSRFCSDAALHWVARDLSLKVNARKINIAIHNCSINLLGESGLITGIPFSFQSPYSCDASSLDYSDNSLLYLTELSVETHKLLCHVVLLFSHKQAFKLKEDIELLKEGALNAKQRNLQRQVTETLERQASSVSPPPGGHSRLTRHRRSLSEERLPSSFKVHLEDKVRRSSEERQKSERNNTAYLKRRRKSTPINCREIYDVEYIGLVASVGSQLPHIDKTVQEIQKNRNCQDSSSAIRGLLLIGYNEIQLLNMDHVTVVRAWRIKHIKACAQGARDSSFIGWSCRDMCGEEEARECVHVFRATSPDMGVTILHSIHKMCLNAYNQVKDSSQVSHKGLCKICPIVIFNNICKKLNGLTADEVVQELSNVIGSLSAEDSLEVLQMFKTEQKDVNAQNSLLVGCLRTIYERQQANHSHSATPGSNKQKNEAVQRRTRSVCVAALCDPPVTVHQPLMTASDRRRARRQKSSVRKAIYDSVNLTNKPSESMLSHQSPDEDSLSLETLISSGAGGYDVVSARDEEQLKHWETLLERQETGGGNSESLRRDIESAVFSGVPDSIRGKIWKTLAAIRKCKDQPVPSLIPYPQLIENAGALAKNAIFLDIGRTYPTHPYFKEELGPGQTALSNLLTAYSTYDMEVGYCQGIGFIAGIILAYHADEEEAFGVFTDLLTKYTLRDVYKPHMSGLKLRLYQLSRLVHDRHFNIHAHLNTHEVTPSLYAVSWIMTAFATELPFRIAVRIMDFIFLQGVDAIFKVILYTLEASESEILSLKSFEVLMNYMKETIPQKIDASFEYRVKDIFSVDLSLELRELEIEYKVLHEDLESANKTELLETKYNLLKLQNKCHANQITQLNKELERSRSEKRGLTAQMEGETALLNATISLLRDELDCLRRERDCLRSERNVLLPESGYSGENDTDPLSKVNMEKLIAEQYIANT